jgi:hypothetical protein
LILQWRPFEAKTAQRIIDPKHREIFIKSLEHAPKGKVNVWVSWVCGEETSSYASQILHMIKDAGYDTANSLSMSSAVPEKGIIIWVKNAKARPPFADMIGYALKAADVNIDAQIELTNAPAGVGENEVGVYVGGKP